MSFDILDEKILIKSKNIILRKPLNEDLQDIFDYSSDMEITKYLRFANHKTLLDTKTFFIFAQNQTQNKTGVVLVIEHIKDKKVIGHIGFRNLDSIFEKAEIGFLLSKNYWGQGIMSEAVTKMIEFGFRKLKLNRIEAFCDIENFRGNKLLKTFMQKEGLLREVEKKDSRFINMHIYSILKKEFLLKKI
ncbi:MAG: GNAT family N-acetyltransferase [Parachlamydiales bacterium]|nr:GNAT family N-acetyltransferase [Parachlamydiales bacterium]